MKTIDIHEAKMHLEILVEKAAAGEGFIIAKAGKPMVRVMSYKKGENVPRIGFMKGQFSIPNDFDNMHAEEISEIFENG